MWGTSSAGNYLSTVFLEKAPAQPDGVQKACMGQEGTFRICKLMEEPQCLSQGFCSQEFNTGGRAALDPRGARPEPSAPLHLRVGGRGMRPKRGAYCWASCFGITGYIRYS